MVLLSPHSPAQEAHSPLRKVQVPPEASQDPAGPVTLLVSALTLPGSSPATPALAAPLRGPRALHQLFLFLKYSSPESISPLLPSFFVPMSLISLVDLQLNWQAGPPSSALLYFLLYSAFSTHSEISALIFFAARFLLLGGLQGHGALLDLLTAASPVPSTQ